MVMSQPMLPPNAVVHWYDFVCPFCYLAQPDNAALTERGFELIELAYQAHPEIPEGGLPFTSSGPRFEMIARLAADRQMPLHWRDRLPYTMPALAAAEWIRLRQLGLADAFRRAIFHANFADGEDIGAFSVILGHAERIGVEIDGLDLAMKGAAGIEAVRETTSLGRHHGVRGTPAWWYRGHLIEGLPQGGLVHRVSAIAEAAA